MFGSGNLNEILMNPYPLLSLSLRKSLNKSLMEGKVEPKSVWKALKVLSSPSLRFAFQLSRTANDHRMFFVLSRQLKLRSSDVRFAIESALVSVSDFGSDKDSPERGKSFNEDNKRRRIALTSDRKISFKFNYQI